MVDPVHTPGVLIVVTFLTNGCLDGSRKKAMIAPFLFLVVRANDEDERSWH
jgi:hypothetical protein